MQKTNTGISRWVRGRLNHISYEWYDGGYDLNGHRQVGNTYHFLMGFVPQRQYTHDSQVIIDPAECFGLIIEPVAEGSDVYRRIGAFCHPHGTWTVADLQPKPEPGECAEFEGFDPDNYQRHTVTII